MIKIKKGPGELMICAEKQWLWFKNRIAYDVDEKKLTKDEKDKIKDKLKKRLKIKKKLGPLYNRLEEIIKASRQDLETMLQEKAFQGFYLDPNEKIAAQKKYDDCERQLQSLSRRKKRLKLFKKKWKNDPNYIKNCAKIDEKIQKKDDELSQLQKDLGMVIAKYKANETNFNKKTSGILDLFGYDKLRSAGKKWNSKILCESLGVSVCPYCNRQYIFGIYTEDEKWVSGTQLDHYYPKGLYPLFSCSFFNLIPSCYCCNHGKGENNLRTAYPYEDDYEDRIVFRLDSKDLDFVKNIQIQKKGAYKVYLEKRGDAHLENSDEVFHLTELYNEHQLEIKNIIVRFAKLEKAGLAPYAVPYFGMQYSQLSEEQIKELKSFVLGDYLGNEFSEHPMRKFESDLIACLEGK